MAILGPALLALIFVVVQAGLWFYARSLALAAANEGVTAGRAYQAPPGAGPARARAFIADHAGDSLLAATVTDTGSDATTVRIQVSGRALSVLTGIDGWTGHPVRAGTTGAVHRAGATMTVAGSRHGRRRPAGP